MVSSSRVDHDRPALAFDQHRVGVGEADGDPHAVGDLDHSTVLLLTVALLVCWLPARRGARLSPLEALRTE